MLSLTDFRRMPDKVNINTETSPKLKNVGVCVFPQLVVGLEGAG